MSEFMEKHAVSRLIGSPPGYVGYEDSGQLTEKVRRKPHCIVLFDEIEKAHPDVMNILLQILDEGRITDSHGRMVNFENTILIMTSNAGNSDKVGVVGFNKTQNQINAEETMSALKKFLRTEFLARVDEIISFNQLTSENLKDIARKMLEELKEALLEKGLVFEYDNELINCLVKQEEFKNGARDLKKEIRKKVEDSIVNLIIKTHSNLEKVAVSVNDGDVVVV